LDGGEPNADNIINALVKGKANAAFSCGPDGPEGILNIGFDGKYPMKHSIDYKDRPFGRITSSTNYD